MEDSKRHTDAPHRGEAADHTGRNLALFAGMVLGWILLDRLIKDAVLAYPAGTELSDSIGGLFHLEIVHNRGAAWGLFSDGTALLIVLSLVICGVLLAYLLWRRRQASIGEVVGLALVFAGGIGNLIDRMSYGYVVDLFAFDFVDFPVFNVADIGVCCGFVILLISLIVDGLFRSGADRS